MGTTGYIHPAIGRRRAGVLMLSGLVLAGHGATGTAAASGEKEIGSTAMGGPMRLGVTGMDVVTIYTPGSSESHIEHRLPRTPAEQFEEWARTRLAPEDDRGSLQVTVVKASLTEEELPAGKGFSAFFRDEQSRLVHVEFEGVFHFSHPERGGSMTITVMSEYEHSIAESASTSEADKVRMGVVTEGLALFDQEFRRQLREASASGWPLLGG